MKIKQYRHIVILASGFVFTGALYIWFIQSAYFEPFNIWTQHNIVTFSLFLFLVKVAGIVWPPIPGGILTAGSIPLLGWWQAFLIDFSGSMVGSSIAFLIGRTWGMRFMAHIFDEAALEKIRHMRIPAKKELEAIFIFRFFGGNIVEIICYAAGMLRVRYSRYMLASIGAHIVIGIPFYYFASEVFSGRRVVLAAVFIAIAITLFIKLRTRYLVYGE